MKIQTLFLATSLLAITAIGQPSAAAADRFMGDWQGSVTVNGQTQTAAVYDNLELPKVTGGAVNEQEGQAAGLLLQDHGNPVQYRKIWVERIQ